jgi:hypothetical protein
MKYSISQRRLHDFIYDYLNRNYYPDSWNVPRVVSDPLWVYGVNDKPIFGFYKTGVKHHRFGENIISPNTLMVMDDGVLNNLNGLFGEFWLDVMKDWYETNSGQEVEQIIDFRNNILKEYF